MVTVTGDHFHQSNPSLLACKFEHTVQAAATFVVPANFISKNAVTCSLSQQDQAYLPAGAYKFYVANNGQDFSQGGKEGDLFYYIAGPPKASSVAPTAAATDGGTQVSFCLCCCPLSSCSCLQWLSLVTTNIGTRWWYACCPGRRSR